MGSLLLVVQWRMRTHFRQLALLPKYIMHQAFKNHLLIQCIFKFYIAHTRVTTASILLCYLLRKTTALPHFSFVVLTPSVYSNFVF